MNRLRQRARRRHGAGGGGGHGDRGAADDDRKGDGDHVVSASWSTSRARWTVHTQTELGESVLTCAFLHMCTGYYRYDEGYTPSLPGIENFTGAVIHPQQWPDRSDLSGRRVVVIG